MLTKEATKSRDLPNGLKTKLSKRLSKSSQDSCYQRKKRKIANHATELVALLITLIYRGSVSSKGSEVLMI